MDELLSSPLHEAGKPTVRPTSLEHHTVSSRVHFININASISMSLNIHTSAVSNANINANANADTTANTQLF